MTTIAQSVFASVAHRYWHPGWTEERNREVFAGDASVEGLGANMRIELAGDAADHSEMEIGAALTPLKNLLDHQCLFAADAPFALKPSTLENVTLYLAGHLDGGQWSSLTVWESATLGCRWSEKRLTLIFKQRNLTLEIVATPDAESGLAISRNAVRNAVENLLVKLNSFNDPDLQRWGGKIFSALQASIPELTRLRVDLGRHEGIVVHSGN